LHNVGEAPDGGDLLVEEVPDIFQGFEQNPISRGLCQAGMLHIFFTERLDIPDLAELIHLFQEILKCADPSD
jgi:hypothetical protein